MAGKSKRIKSQGLKLEISSVPSEDLDAQGLVFVDLSATGKQVSYQGGQSDEIDTTTFASDEKEFELGLGDPGELSVEGNYKPSDAGQAVLLDAHRTKNKYVVRISFADEDKTQSLVVGMVRQYQWQAAVNGIVSSTYSLRLSGATKIVTTPPAGN
ncbi:phage tail tube protein [Burkholderia gladioli]|uniref:phage tail tube protein n=1 Tax=Burkholderia gladioli TaxID=28095 RepID=UPI00163E7D82|nr:phage tail tube protein [Burkholderia gladioli]